MSRVICLGEGNFSFARVLLHHLCTLPAGSEAEVLSSLVATSFDSHEDLVSKYSDINSKLSSLTKDSRVIVKHSIDASIPLANQLDLPSIEFDHIIFNFPHLGFEDAVAHASLLGHFFAAAKPSMNGEFCIAYLTLTMNQSVRWRAIEMAERNGLQLLVQLKLREETWEGYECKRHQVGKSFRARIVGDEAFTFCFIKAGLESSIVTECMKRNLFQHVYNVTEMKSVELSSSKSDSTKHQAKSRKLDSECTSSGGGSSFYRHLEGVTELAWECVECGKRFRTQQGVGTHFHTQHEMISKTQGNTLGKQSESTKSLFMCVGCDRVFASDQALQQHMVSKHFNAKISSTGDINVNTQMRSTASLSDPTNSSENEPAFTVECSSCGQQFATQSQLDEHRISFKPRTSRAELPCELCGRLFVNSRALAQHVAYGHTVISDGSAVSKE